MPYGGKHMVKCFSSLAVSECHLGWCGHAFQIINNRLHHCREQKIDFIAMFWVYHNYLICFLRGVKRTILYVKAYRKNI